MEFGLYKFRCDKKEGIWTKNGTKEVETFTGKVRSPVFGTSVGTKQNRRRECKV